jgi:hypothetical protein
MDVVSIALQFRFFLEIMNYVLFIMTIVVADYVEKEYLQYTNEKMVSG